ncbi:LysR family transcriptional regulator [Asanoa siamensis]|uniref:LysR family transcriptional regulator n=1 Tax=Asanoa siamensis TaxID=926357 RepID=A0ABQ4D443_9ACTN|nr:LysR substrate-binding domain-containing protein [Asanoa siamensis]GIF78023.1 LysR family transcriptional regulator [Asanoa siamensis]
MDLDLRKVRYFVAVAEELNFGRAADRLRIAQPALSRQIRALEKELHIELFERSSRGTALTPAGTQLLADAGPVLAAADAMERRARLAARGTAPFTVAFMPGILVTPVVRAFTDAYPGIGVEVLRTSYYEQVAVLHDGRADVSFVRLPVPVAGLTVVPLFAEARVVAVPAGHPLAGKERLHVDDIADEHLLQDPDLVPEWRDIARDVREGSSRWRSGPGSTMEEKLEHVAAEEGIIIVPRSTAALYTRPDVVYRPLDGIADNQVAVAYSTQRGSAEVEQFADLAVRLLRTN